MKIANPFRLALIATLGVGVGLLIWGAVGNLTTILTYIGAALFIALGIDPLIKLLERRGMPRGLALGIVVLLAIGVLTGVILAIVPIVATQAGAYIERTIQFFSDGGWDRFIADLQGNLPEWIDLSGVAAQVADFFSNNIGGVAGGVVNVGLGIANGLFGGLIILILTLYFTVSLDSIKRTMYRFVPASKRERFAELSEEISQSVGRYVIGQATVALINAVISFIVLTVVGAPFPAVLAFLAFLLAMIPLVGSLASATIITLSYLLLGQNTWLPWWALAIIFVVYMQIEANIISPRVMNRAVSVPAPIVVIAALVGGTLLGLLGALIAIPVAASIMLIMREVVIPKQDAK
mgnify:CR=1 FL=1